MTPRRTRYRIGALRTRAGVTRAQLAEAAGRNPKTIERYENGHLDPPGEVLAKMAGRLGTTVDELLGIPARPPSEMRIEGRLYIAAPPEPPNPEPANGESEASAFADAATALGPVDPPDRRPRERTPRSRRAARPSPDE